MHQSEGGWGLLSKGEKGKTGRGWALKDGRLARSAQVLASRPQQDHNGGQVATFQQAAIGGGGTFGSASEQGRDFNLLSAFEQFVKGSQGPGIGKTRTRGTGREKENPRYKIVNKPEIENKRKERGEGRRAEEESLSKLQSTSRTETNTRRDEEREETNVKGSGVDAGSQKQIKASVREKQEGSSEEEMLRQMMVGSSSISKESISKQSKVLQNRTTVDSSPPLAQSVVTPLMGENPVAFVGKNSISEEGNAVSLNRPGKERGGGGAEIKDKNGAATDFPQTEMGSKEEDAGGKERTTKRENISSDLNGAPTVKGPLHYDRGELFINIFHQMSCLYRKSHNF